MRFFQTYLLEDLLLTEAYSHEKTVANFSAPLDARAKTPIALTPSSESDEFFGSTFQPSSFAWKHRLADYHDGPDMYTAKMDPSYPMKADGKTPDHDEFVKRVAAAMPHPKYTQAALKMYTNPEGGVHRAEDVTSTVADKFQQYHTLASSGKMDSSLWAANPNLQKNHERNVKELAQMKDGIAKDIANGHPVGRRQQTHHDDLERLVVGNKEISKGPKHTEFNRFDSLKHIDEVIKHPMYKEILDPTPKISSLKSGEDYDVIHDNDEATFYHAKTAKAAYVLAHHPVTGEKASWCTAPDPKNKNAHNYFDGKNLPDGHIPYVKQGPHVIVHPKHGNDIYQVHTSSDQWMNQHDDDVDENVRENSDVHERGEGMGLYQFSHHHIVNWSNQEIIRNTHLYPHYNMHGMADIAGNEHYDDSSLLPQSVGVLHAALHILENSGSAPDIPRDEVTKFVPLINRKAVFSSPELKTRIGAQIDSLFKNPKGVGPKTRQALADNGLPLPK